MKISILIPHFMEDESIVKSLLDSIDLQQYIDFDDIEVLICNDGNKSLLSPWFLNQYKKFKIKYTICEKHGVSAVRNSLLEDSIGDYVMFCDADDILVSNIALFSLMRSIQNDEDVICSSFYESYLNPNTKKLQYLIHNVDRTRIHGKLYKKDFLLKNNIKFDENLYTFEDKCFNGIVFATTNKVIDCNLLTVLWRYNSYGLIRRDKDFIITNNINFIYSSDKIIECLLENKKEDQAKNYLASTIFQSYLILNKINDEWLEDGYKNLRISVVENTKILYNKYKELYNKVSKTDLDNMQKLLNKPFESKVSKTYNEWFNEVLNK